MIPDYKKRKPNNSRPSSGTASYRYRFLALNFVFAVVAVVLMVRAIQLQVVESGFLQREGASRYQRTVTVNAYRGAILDRNGEVLAMSAPVRSVWVNPQKLQMTIEQASKLASYLGFDRRVLEKKIRKNAGQTFLYLKRQVPIETARSIEKLGIAGLELEKAYKRYYPEVDSAAHVVGFTNLDGKGIDGCEMQYDAWLKGQPGKKEVIRSAKGGVIENVQFLKTPVSGHDLELSIDSRLQYVVYESLMKAVRYHHAKSASAVVLSVPSGEILAMSNYPSYNPNFRSGSVDARYRNRAATDEFEPGSTAKPFAIAAALEQGLITTNSVISTSPGTLRIGKKTIRDHRNYGNLDVAGILRHSSNVGASKLALMMPYRDLYDAYVKVGFGQPSGSFFPGEATGNLDFLQRPHKIEQAALSYGYGLSTTVLQLARAYLPIANHGRLPQLTLRPGGSESLQINQVMSATVADQVRGMLEGVIDRKRGGTGSRAAVPGYRVAGKTGTVHKNSRGQYMEDKYIALFAGMIPASRPRLVMVVMVDRPSAGEYYGGSVAAPIFSYVMRRAVRILNIPPDALNGQQREPILQARSDEPNKVEL
ncbi:MAG: penicillin-binding protein 2 [Gammaproteobacteria bacterium]|nr:MAG: penicillin-binding protein 2 [Gammaproteobacteria bacterium]